jgi:small subunit ribosomal protein S5
VKQAFKYNDIITFYMTDDVAKKDTPTKPEAPVKGAAVPADTKREARPKREFKKNRRPSRRQAPRSEFDQRILAIRRVTRVSSGGRRFSFSVAMAIGNGSGKIGVGTGKASDTALAIEKAAKDAKKNIIEVARTNTDSIPHEVNAKYSSAVVTIQPSPGRGTVAGSAVRDLVELAGINDVVGKIMSGSKNKLNIARATLKAFETLEAPKAHHAPTKKEKKSTSTGAAKTSKNKEGNK